MRALVDTNILIDYFGRREPFFQWWAPLLVMQEFGDIELWVAPQSFADTFYVLSRQVPADALQKAFHESLSFLKVCTVGSAEVAEATRRSWSDYEDCLVALCAESIDADVLLSRDADGFKDAKMPVHSLEGFFHMLRSEYGIIYEEIDL